MFEDMKSPTWTLRLWYLKARTVRRLCKNMHVVDVVVWYRVPHSALPLTFRCSVSVTVV